MDTDTQEYQDHTVTVMHFTEEVCSENSQQLTHINIAGMHKIKLAKDAEIAGGNSLPTFLYLLSFQEKIYILLE